MREGVASQTRLLRGLLEQAKKLRRAPDESSDTDTGSDDSTTSGDDGRAKRSDSSRDAGEIERDFSRNNRHNSPPSEVSSPAEQTDEQTSAEKREQPDDDLTNSHDATLPNSRRRASMPQTRRSIAARVAARAAAKASGVIEEPPASDHRCTQPPRPPAQPTSACPGSTSRTHPSDSPEHRKRRDHEKPGESDDHRQPLTERHDRNYFEATARAEWIASRAPKAGATATRET